MNPQTDNRFQAFFEEPAYTGLKNLLYNYRVRRRHVLDHVGGGRRRLLEVGSGISPVTRPGKQTVYSDLSFTAMQALCRSVAAGCFVVADARRLPFRNGAFQEAVCSEVLEHIREDTQCIGELERVLSAAGRLVVTFPHRAAYFANDDRFVRHFRRYELDQMKERLGAAGLAIRHVEKVLGPLEKATMAAVVCGIQLARKIRGGSPGKRRRRPVPARLHRLFDLFNRMYMAPIRLDAAAMPRSMASVLLIVAEKRRAGGPNGADTTCKSHELL